MQLKPHEILNSFKPKRIVWPIIIGLGVAAALIINDFDKEAFTSIVWSWKVFFWLMMAVLMMLVRDFFYMYRIRVLTEYKLNWYRSFVVIMLWEFASAITPSIVGGAAFALLLLNKENISAGRSTAIVLVSTFLDELFYVLLVPVIYFSVGHDKLFLNINENAIQEITHGNGMFYIFSVGYVLIFAYTSLLAYGLFFNPRGLKWLMVKVFALPLLRTWRMGALQAGNDLVVASRELKQQPASFWTKSFGATVLSWAGRFAVVNCLILAFHTGGDQVLIYARQLIMWIIMLISPTPGSSGVAEIVFSTFLSEFITNGLQDVMSLLWRLISYYPYLIIGAIILPRWIRRKFLVHHEPKSEPTQG